MPPEITLKRQQREARKLREKRRKQRKALAQTALIAAALITLALILILFTSVEFTEESYIVSEGDTLWGLYTEHGDGADWETWLHEMLTVNGIGNDAALTAGDEIILLTAE
jgi:hypothetical protein